MPAGDAGTPDVLGDALPDVDAELAVDVEVGPVDAAEPDRTPLGVGLADRGEVEGTAVGVAAGVLDAGAGAGRAGAAGPDGADTDDAGRTRKYSTRVATQNTPSTRVDVRIRTCARHHAAAVTAPPWSARRCPGPPGR